MRGRGSIAEQNDVLVAPALAQDTIEIEPGRAAQMAGIRHQLVGAEIAGKELLAGRNRLLNAHPVEAGTTPGLLRAFDNKGRCVGVELVGVHPYPAVFGLLEDECKRVVE